jgi:hypothetical protein
MSIYRLNLDLSPHKFARGSVEVFLNWANRVDSNETEPAMIFRRKLGDKRGLVAVRLSEIHNFIGSSGYPLGSTVEMAGSIASHLGFVPTDKSAVRDVVDLLVDHTEDLVRMPPEPPAAPTATHGHQAKAELELQLGGKTVLETEIAE